MIQSVSSPFLSFLTTVAITSKSFSNCYVPLLTGIGPKGLRFQRTSLKVAYRGLQGLPPGVA